ncbi:MAG: hypothetical protein ABFE08_16300 [Armatimonadia bacterium]
MVDNALQQVLAAARRGGLLELFPNLAPEPDDVRAVEALADGEAASVRFGDTDGPLGTLFLDAYDSGNPDDGGLTVGLRGWRLDGDVASV